MVVITPKGINRINSITWRAPLGTRVPTQYRIYRNAALTDLVAIIVKPLLFDHHHRQRGIVYRYFIVAKYSNGQTSEPAKISVIWK